jgi:hypothetical protein
MTVRSTGASGRRGFPVMAVMLALGICGIVTTLL